MMTDAFLPSVRFVVSEDLKDLRAGVEGLPGEALDWKPAGDDTNSIAVLVTHVLNSTRSWMSVAVGAPLPERDRDSEFRANVGRHGGAARVHGRLLGADHGAARLSERGRLVGTAQDARPPRQRAGDVPAAWAVLHAHRAPAGARGARRPDAPAVGGATDALLTAPCTSNPRQTTMTAAAAVWLVASLDLEPEPVTRDHRLAGGVGAARFLQGLLAVHRPSDVTIISNVGDDCEFFGLHVSPDIDIVLYHLAGLADEERGFGLKGDTFNVIDSHRPVRLRHLVPARRPRPGDVHHAHATCCARGKTLAEATAEIAAALLVPARITPVTNDRLRTKIRTDDGVLDFQEYFVKRRTEGHAWEIIYDGAESAQPAPGVIEAIREASAVILTPSNPLVSIGPILAVPGVREALRETKAKVAAVSPIVGGQDDQGPGRPHAARPGPRGAARSAIAKLYADFLDVLVIDKADEALAPEIEGRWACGAWRSSSRTR